MTVATDAVALVSQEIRLGARANRLIAELNRDEYSLAADPSLYTEASASVTERRARVADTLKELRQSATVDQAALLDAVERQLARYSGRLDQTLQTARGAQGAVVLSQAQQAVVDAVTASRQDARLLRDAISAFVDHTENRGSALAVAADELAQSRTTLLVTVAAIGILFGLALGWVVAQKGVVQPIRAIVACLRRLADGDTAVAITGTDRRDEVGTIAATAEVFKTNLIRNREMEREAKEAEERSRAERRRAMLELADQFESSVKGVVEAVSAAAVQLQSNARDMSAIAEQTTRQSTAVAAATEQASANVQTVAAASEELGSSITEISRRVSESARISRDAQGAAERTNTTVEGLATAAQRIGDVVSLIQNIA
ncbi:HAMP domain-containing protein, partial [Azospirillum halopraeferens]|uniref:HAMP domain-containing protein n=1 Tax=Azospirillum halopraeferens TaxID=34010 RepID=UPI00146FB7F1